MLRNIFCVSFFVHAMKFSVSVHSEQRRVPHLCILWQRFLVSSSYVLSMLCTYSTLHL
jgi:hypothetical protein